MDVVEPNKDLKIVKNKNIWKTDGKTTLGGDDKEGIAAILYAIKYMIENENEYGDIYAILTPGEEMGMLGAISIDWKNVYSNMTPSKNMIVFDNSGKSQYIAYQAPTSYEYSIEVFGKSAHAGIEPENRISAIKILF